MRKVVYGGAMSLDGFIAGPNGEYDWIVSALAGCSFTGSSSAKVSPVAAPSTGGRSAQAG